ncbi:PQQ-binding-like beta-propeller repeat protein [Parasphingopyxis lamellibrachiae]|uniref:Outer membrane protein assembly factor BamB n=1 Tax=Parasphingopyxis lamellibrachiae TaxID=680125 RepID=A0A3D9FF85_9SPHN|nr:PQQ-binding-like beta-propeller repeat protein [Parasphingopyxis lamellibrachiae]RED16439.1 outer membrane protein assembly factor BamB [Parasphingopyxis lamellibrachiae]
MMRILILSCAALALSGCGLFSGSDDATPTVGNRTPILVSENDVQADPQIASVPVVLPPAAVNAGWTQPGGSASKSLGHLALSNMPVRVWSTSIGDGGGSRARLAAAPVVSNGRVFTIDTEATVRAFDVQTGGEVWSMRFGTEIGSEPALFGGGISISGDRLYVTNGVGYAGALNITDGSQIWKVRPGGPLRGAPTIANNNVYVLSQDNQIFALDPANGETRWTVSGTLEVSGVFGVAAPASAQGTLVAGFSSGELIAYRYENGQIVWQDGLNRTSISTSVSTLSDIDASPVIDSGFVYAIGQGGRMVALRLITGERIWEVNAGGLSTPWIAGDWMFAVTDDARVMAIARANGRIRWITQLPRYRNEEKRKGPIFWRGPVLAGGQLVLVSSRGHLVFMDPASGTVSRTDELDEGVELSPVVADNTLFLLDSDGELSAWR